MTLCVWGWGRLLGRVRYGNVDLPAAKSSAAPMPATPPAGTAIRASFLFARIPVVSSPTRTIGRSKSTRARVVWLSRTLSVRPVFEPRARAIAPLSKSLDVDSQIASVVLCAGSCACRSRRRRAGARGARRLGPRPARRWRTEPRHARACASVNFSCCTHGEKRPLRLYL